MAFHPRRSHQPSYPLPPTHPTMVLTYALAVVALQRLSWPVTPPTVGGLPPRLYIDKVHPTIYWYWRVDEQIITSSNKRMDMASIRSYKTFCASITTGGWWLSRPMGYTISTNHIYLYNPSGSSFCNTTSYGMKQHQLSTTQQSTSIWKWYITRSGGSRNNISQKKAGIAHYYGIRWMRYPNTCEKRRKRGM